MTENLQELEALKALSGILVNRHLEPYNSTKATYKIGLTNKQSGKQYEAKLQIRVAPTTEPSNKVKEK